MLDRLGVDDAMRQQVMYGNMARILGLGDSVG
jgi:hypothetical protein